MSPGSAEILRQEVGTFSQASCKHRIGQNWCLTRGVAWQGGRAKLAYTTNFRSAVNGKAQEVVKPKAALACLSKGLAQSCMGPTNPCAGPGYQLSNSRCCVRMAVLAAMFSSSASAHGCYPFQQQTGEATRNSRQETMHARKQPRQTGTHTHTKQTRKRASK